MKDGSVNDKLPVTPLVVCLTITVSKYDGIRKGLGLTEEQLPDLPLSAYQNEFAWYFFENITDDR